MCKVLKVNKSSYYHWIRTGCITKKVDIQLNDLIETIFIQGRKNYGTRRIQDKLKELYGALVSRKRVSSIMKELGLKVNMKRRYKNTTDSNHNLPIAPNLRMTFKRATNREDIRPPSKKIFSVKSF